jgi:hypothetical protein
VVEGQRHQVFGFGAGDQHGGGDAEPQRVEFAVTDEVGDRDPFAAAADEFAKGLTLRAAGLGAERRVKFDARAPQRVGQEDFGVEPRRIAAALPKKVGRPAQ